MRRIRMKNYSGSEASVTWHIKEDSIHSSPFYLSNSRTQRFVLQPGDRINMSAGIGSWNKKNLAGIVDDLDSLVITWEEQELVLSDPREIHTYLFARRRGLDKAKIDLRMNK